MSIERSTDMNPGEFPMYRHQRLNNAPVVPHYPAATLQIGGRPPFYLGKRPPSRLTHRIYR